MGGLWQVRDIFISIPIMSTTRSKKDHGFIFPVQVSMESVTILADGHENALTPGMSVQVEVRTGDRRVIEYLLTPLIRYKEEAIRER